MPYCLDCAEYFEGSVCPNYQSYRQNPKPYAKLTLTEEELATVRSAVEEMRQVVFQRWNNAMDPDEKNFYRERISAYDKLKTKLDKPLYDDKSQDASDEDESEEDDG